MLKCGVLVKLSAAGKERQRDRMTTNSKLLFDKATQLCAALDGMDVLEATAALQLAMVLVQYARDAAEVNQAEAASDARLAKVQGLVDMATSMAKLPPISLSKQTHTEPTAPDWVKDETKDEDEGTPT